MAENTSQRIRDTIRRMWRQEFSASDIVQCFGPHHYESKTFNTMVHNLLRREMAKGTVERITHGGYRLTHPGGKQPDDYIDLVTVEKVKRHRTAARRFLQIAIDEYRTTIEVEWATRVLTGKWGLTREQAGQIAELDVPGLNRRHCKRHGIKYAEDGSMEYPPNDEPQYLPTVSFL